MDVTGITLSTIDGVALEGAAELQVTDGTIEGPFILRHESNTLLVRNQNNVEHTFDSLIGSNLQDGMIDADQLRFTDYVTIAGAEGAEGDELLAFVGVDEESRWDFDGPVTVPAGVAFANPGTTVFHDQVSGGAQFTDTTGTAQFLGGYAPGDSPGMIEFGGDVLLGEENILVMELAGLDPGSQHDQLAAGNEGSHQVLTLGGTLEVVLLDDFEPTLGDVLELLAFDELVANFDDFVLPDLAALIDNDEYDLGWNIDELSAGGDGTITVIPEPGSQALLAVFGSLLLLRRRRHTRQMPFPRE